MYQRAALKVTDDHRYAKASCPPSARANGLAHHEQRQRPEHRNKRQRPRALLGDEVPGVGCVAGAEQDSRRRSALSGRSDRRCRRDRLAVTQGAAPDQGLVGQRIGADDQVLAFLDQVHRAVLGGDLDPHLGMARMNPAASRPIAACASRPLFGCCAPKNC